MPEDRGRRTRSPRGCRGCPSRSRCRACAWSGLELDLAADQVELGALGVLERLGPLLEQRAAVGHRLVEEEREELVGDVVVVADHLGVALARVARAAGLELGGRRRRRASQPAARRGCERRSAPWSASESGGACQRPSSAITAVQVVDVDLALDVGAAEPELARRAQHVAQRPRRVEASASAPARVDSTAFPSQKRSVKGRSGKALDRVAERCGGGVGHAASLPRCLPRSPAPPIGCAARWPRAEDRPRHLAGADRDGDRGLRRRQRLLGDQRRHPLDRAGLRHDRRHDPVGGERLRAHLRRPDRHRRAPGRPVRAQAHLLRRRRDLRRRCRSPAASRRARPG